eukprot:749085-Lingulodinium_polyedra.AAC.1
MRAISEPAQQQNAFLNSFPSGFRQTRMERERACNANALRHRSPHDADALHGSFETRAPFDITFET